MFTDGQTTEIAGMVFVLLSPSRNCWSTHVGYGKLFAAGISVPFLMAAHETEEQTHARAGFSVIW